jgi:hypothetical protein
MKLEQERIVLWGAANAGSSYARRHPDANIVAFVDNDPKKWGARVENIPVLSPDELLSQDFETIVIAAWGIVPIRRQIETMSFKRPVNVIEPGKGEIAPDIFPFSHGETQEFARNALIFLNQCAKENDVKLFLDFGTLLGVLRDGELIPEDSDIDLSVSGTNCFRKTKNLILPQFHKFIISKNGCMKSFILKIKGNEASLVLFLTFPESNIIDFAIDIKKRVLLGEYIVTQTIPAWRCPKNFFLSCDYFPAFGESFVVPKAPESYLSFLYGNWKTKRNDFRASEYGGIETDIPWVKPVLEEIDYSALATRADQQIEA